MEGYCVKCRAKREIKDAKAITMKNGKPATQGVCPNCGTKMFRIGKSQVYTSLAIRIGRAGIEFQPFFFLRGQLNKLLLLESGLLQFSNSCVCYSEPSGEMQLI